MIDPMDCVHPADDVELLEADWSPQTTPLGEPTSTEVRAARCGACGVPIIQARSAE